MSEFPIRPILGRVIVRVDELGEVVSDSGIIVALDSRRSLQQRRGTNRIATIVAMDSKHKDCPKDVKIGDRMFFQNSWQGESWEWENETYHTLEGDDVSMVIEDDGVKVEAVTA